MLRCVEKFHFKIEFNSQAGTTLLNLNEGRHFPRMTQNPTIIYHSLSRRACGHVDVGTCPHQVLAATLTYPISTGDYTHPILVTKPIFESHRPPALRLISQFQYFPYFLDFSFDEHLKPLNLFKKGVLVKFEHVTASARLLFKKQ